MKATLSFIIISLSLFLFGCGVSGGSSYIEPNYDPYTNSAEACTQNEDPIDNNESRHFVNHEDLNDDESIPCPPNQMEDVDENLE